MLAITEQDIYLNQHAKSKELALEQIEASLRLHGLTKSGYLQGMLDRELQANTFLGQGIAIPHGSVATRNLVKKTGIVLYHFPEGVDWSDDNSGDNVYLAIGIAAQSDEHLQILKQLTRVLAQDGILEIIKKITNVAEILQLFNKVDSVSDSSSDLVNAAVDAPLYFDISLIEANCPATSLIQLNSFALNLIKQHQEISSVMLHNIMAETPIYLGDGLWLLQSVQEFSKNMLSFIKPEIEFRASFQEGVIKQDLPVLGLLMLLIKPKTKNLNSFVASISELINTQKIHDLLKACPKTVLDILSKEYIDPNSRRVTLNNIHGLHARPAALLVIHAKTFTQDISICNITQKSAAINAKSLSALLGLGAMCFDILEINSKDPQALNSVCNFINKLEDL